MERVSLVSGASRGIGRQVALDLSKSGSYVIGVARASNDLTLLDSALQTMAGGGRTIALDLDSPNALKELLAKIEVEPDILVHNVGGNLGLTNPLGGSDEFLSVIRHNLAISIDLNSHYVPKMQARGWGRVCHISSISALENQGPPAYSAAKAGVNAYVRGLGRYVARDGVVVTAVMPGAVMTEGGYWDVSLRERPEHVNRFISERMAIGRFGTVEEISSVVGFLVSEEASFMSGSCVLVDGGQGRVIQMVDTA
jgi:3-oxoacyl-[acyl-carrier protein] reductase